MKPILGRNPHHQRDIAAWLFLCLGLGGRLTLGTLLFRAGQYAGWHGPGPESRNSKKTGNRAREVPGHFVPKRLSASLRLHLFLARSAPKSR